MMRFLRLRYSLRTLMLLVTATAALFGWESYIEWKEERAARAIEGLLGSVTYEQVGPQWVRRFAGDDYLRRVDTADVYAETFDDAIPHLQRFGNLQQVRVLYVQPYVYVGSGAVEWPIPEVHRYVYPFAHIRSGALESAHPGVAVDNYKVHENMWSGQGSWLEKFPPKGPPPLPFGYEKERRPRAAVEKWLDRIGINGLGLDTRERIVGITKGRYLRLLIMESSRGTVRQPGHESVALLLDSNDVIDHIIWRSPSEHDQIELVYEDLNADGRPDVGAHYWRLSDKPKWAPSHLPKNRLATTQLPNDPRLWLDAYEITPTGFESLFEDAEGSGDE